MPEQPGGNGTAPAVPSSRDQHYRLAVALLGAGHDTRGKRLQEISRLAHREVPAFAALTRDEAERIIEAIEEEETRHG